MAYTEEQLKEAARKAYAAGDIAAAKRLIAAAKAASAVDPNEQAMKDRIAAAKAGTLKVSPENAAKQAEIDAGVVDSVAKEARDPGAVGAFMANLAPGLTFGFADELAAGIGSVFEDRTYDQILSGLRSREKEIMAQHPVASIGGQVAGSMAIPAMTWKGGAGLLGNALRSAAVGGGQGALYGFGTGEGGAANRATDAMWTGLMGGAIGGMIPVAGALAKKGYDAVQMGRATKQAIASAPSTDALRAAGNAAYDAVDKAGVVVTPGAFANATGGIVGDMTANGMRLDVGRSLAPKSADLAEVMFDMATSPKYAAGVPFSEIDTLRKVASAPASDMGNRLESSLGTRAIEGIDDFINNLKPGDVAAGNAADLPQLIATARGVWSKMLKSGMVDDAVEASKNYLSGEASGIRNQFRRILNSKKLSRGFTDAEKKAMRKVINGTIPEQLLNLASGGLGQMVTMGTGASLGGIPGFLGGALIAGTARKGAEAISRKNAEAVRALIAAGGAANYKQLPAETVGLIEAILGKPVAPIAGLIPQP